MIDIENKFKLIEEKFEKICKEQDEIDNDENNQKYLLILNEMTKSRKE